MRRPIQKSFNSLVQRNAARGASYIANSRLSAETRRPFWMRSTAWVMAAVMYLSPVAFLFDEVAQAAPIVDPRAPVQFQPAITQTSTGVPAVNIAQPNANGISVNSYQTFGVDSSGLVLNNSLVSGTPLLGGTLAANPNLAGRTASTIINQVTSTGPASTLVGPLEVFGSPATVIISNPNGLAVNGLSLTNAPGLVLTTGTPQFLTGVGGTSTSFTNAGALAYNVTSGNVTINGPAGANGPGTGIEGTVGNIDVLAQTINLNAPLRADQRVNLIAGNQLVSPAAAGSTGTSYSTASNGAANTAAAIGNGGVAIDASQYGSVTSGQIYIVSTAAGMGARNLGALAATAGNVNVNSNGDITVGPTFGSQNVNLASAGNTTITGTGLANQNYTVNAGGDINATGSVSAGQDVSMNAGGDLSATSVAANGSANLTAGQSMSLGSLSAHDLALQTKTGDLTLNSSVTVPGTIRAQAGRDLTVNGAVQGGSTVDLSGGRNAAINGSVSGVGNTSLTAQSGSALVGGNVQTNGALSVAAAQDAALGGTTQARGPVTIAAQNGSITGQGSVASSQGAVSLNAGQDIQVGGALQSGSTLTTRSGGSTLLGGTVSAPGAVEVTAGQDAILAGDVTTGSTLTVAAGGNAAVLGKASSIGNMSLAAANGALLTTDSVTTLGGLSASGQQGVNLGGTVYSQGNANVTSGAGTVAVLGAISSPGTVAISAGQDAGVAGTVHAGQDAIITAARNAIVDGGVTANGNLSATAGQAMALGGNAAAGGDTVLTAGTDLTVSGNVSGNGTGSLNAGGNLSGSGSASFGQDTTVGAGQAINLSGAVQTGGNLNATAGSNLAVGAVTTVGNATLRANGGDLAVNGAVLSGGNLAGQATGNLTVAGSTTSLGTTTLTAQSGNLSALGDLQSVRDAALSAGQTLAVTGTTQVGGNATLAGTNVITGGTTTVSGTLNAAAQNTLDLSAGQLNVLKDATLSGANVSTGGALIGGNLTASASNQLTTGGSKTLVQGAANLTGANGVTNTSSVLAGGPLTVTGATVTNGSGANLVSTAATTVNATDLNNAGVIAGLTTAVTANGSLANNNGAIIGTNALNVTTGNLAGNQNGVLFAGSTDPASPGIPGDATITVTGGNGTFNNAGGQILAQHDLTLNLQNQAFDPSAAASGTINLGNALTINTQQLNNSGTWAMPGNSVSINATQGFSNSGTISKAGDITLSTNGTLTNSGTISAGNDVNLSGTIVNQAGASILANEDVNLTGATTNAGTVSAVRDVNLNGSSYDNRGASTAAGRNLTANLSGDLTNVGGTVTARNDITITAADVNNSRAGANTTTTTTSATTIAAAGLESALLSAPMGSLTLTMTELSYADGSVTGSQTFTTNITGRVGDMQPASATDVTAADLSGGTFNGIALPTVTQTTTTTQPSGQGGVIAAGHDLSITTGTLNNHGSTISAGNNVTLNVASLDNGGDAAATTITDSIDATSYASFLTQLKAAYAAGTLAAMLESVDALDNPTGAVTVPANVIPTTGPPAVQTSTVTVYTSQNAGKIVAGNNLALTGTGAGLTNAGSLYAGQDLRVTASSFTNQGYHTDTVTSKTGCAAGVSAADCGYFSTMISYPNQQLMFERPGQDFTNAMTQAALAQELLHNYATFGPGNDSANIYGDRIGSQTYSYTQTNNTVFAGRDLVIAAPTVNNTYGNLLAGRDVVIGGAGTTRDNTDLNNPQTNLTQASAVTNTSGNIQAARDIAISTAALANTLSAPAPVYQNYGLTARFGCSGALGNYCDAFVDQQSGDASTITANRNLSISAGSVANTGSLVTAGSQATITAAAGVTNQDQTLNAYWHDRRWAPVLGTGSVPDNFGCGTAVNCGSLFGSDYHAGAGIQPPTPYASLPGTIQAPSLSVTAGGQLQNSGNVMGQQVALTGATIVNGLTSPAVYTPQATASQQVISLGPVGTPVAATKAANLASGTGQIGAGLATVSSTAGTIASASSGALGSALGSGAGAVAAVTGNSVSVPASPNSASVASVPATPPVQTVAGAAAGTTGTATYLVSSPASQVMGSIGPAQLVASLPASLRPDTTQFYYDPFTEDQVLQQAALTQTGQASFISGLSFDNRNQTSVANQEKQVLYGNAIQYAKANNLALGTALTQAQIAALDAPMLWYVEETVPQPGCTATGNASCPTVTALMPQVYLPQNYAVVQHDGTITGQDVSLTATGGGSILNTGSITATDTLTVNGGTLTNQQRSTDIGTQYTFLGSVAGLLTTTGTEVQQGGFMSAGNYQMNVDAVNQIGGALQKLNADGTVDTAGTQQELAALKAQLGNSFTQGTVSNDLHTSFTSLADTGGAFQQIGMAFVVAVTSFITAGAATAMMAGGALAGTVGGSMISAGAAGFMGSAVSQASTGQFSFSTALQGGLTGAITAGLTNGITYTSDSGFGWSGLGSQVSDNSVSALAGVKSVGGALVPQAGTVTAGSLVTQGIAIAGEAGIQAGVQTAIGGGSFLTNFRNSAVSDLAAAVAYGIGDSTDPYTAQNILEHAALGCAASAAEGTGCAGGAAGAAASAVISPLLVYAAATSGADGYAQQAFVGSFSTAVGGIAAALTGQNLQAGETVAQNNALNNDLQHSDKVVQLINKALAANHTLASQYTPDQLLKAAQNVYGGNGGPDGMHVWSSLADAEAGTAARGTTFYKDAQGQYVERWAVPAGAEDTARSIVDNAQHTYGPSYADVTNDNFSQLMSTYIGKFGADSSNFQGVGEGVAGVSLVGSVLKKEASATNSGSTSTILQNKAAGDAYATQTYQNVVGEMPDAVQEVTVKTASGVRTRLDIMGTGSSGSVVCVECKASATAPLTKNQAAAFPEMAQTGATVVGKGKPGFPGGTVIPPTQVQIVRPGSPPKIGN